MLHIEEDLIKLNKAFESKEEAINYCGELFVMFGYVTHQYVEAMIQRDREVTVYIGNNIAIPHGLPKCNTDIIKSGICIVQVPTGVKFETGVAKLLIGIAAKNDEHMDLLSQIAHICMDISNVEKLILATSKKEIIDLLNN